MGIIEKTAMRGGYCKAAQMININGAHTTQMTVWQCVPVAPSESSSSRTMRCACVRACTVVVFSRLGEENDQPGSKSLQPGQWALSAEFLSCCSSRISVYNRLTQDALLCIQRSCVSQFCCIITAILNIAEASPYDLYVLRSQAHSGLK